MVVNLFCTPSTTFYSRPVPNSYDDETILGLKRMIRELGLNQTYHLNAIQNTSRNLDEFRQQLSIVTTDVSNIKESLKEAPQMLNIGKELDSLKSSLATYGATITDMKHSISELKESTQTPSLLETTSSINSTLHSRLNNVIEDLHHHHV